ncbi:Late embryogenesis abundant protein [Citrus sinensis]|uniref:Uncharacterized protein n=1 Tax=Citrus clementina TaxID=85681 RepID=V4TH84_CITCL|nr:late embryogenesis abundant protein At1g64065 [Citrus x clementina]XP_006477513.2 late embryogenesis abundant protein At1g64065 [Citrus sinensis]ESR52692.1 hypothetical protein CICLE_v10023929mg [Citrus x clementina]KAH9719351.1 Late embryogenesis abundant protein [Citrus sinensis]
MAEENPKIPLAPPRNEYPRSDQEYAPAVIESQRKSSKCLVYVLVTIVTVSAALLISASIFLRPNTPEVQLESVTVKNLSHGNGTSPSFNVTLVTELTIDNENYGYFEYKNCSGSVFYGSVTVGDVKIRDGRVEAREVKRINVTVDVDVRSNGNLDNQNLSSDRNSGIVKLNSYAKLHGNVNLFNVLKKTKTPELDCSMNLVLARRAVEDLVCSS